MKNYAPHSRTNPRRTALNLPRVAATLLVAALLAALLSSHLAHGSSSAAPAGPTADSRLVLHAHRVAVAGTLAGVALRGSLYPGFPGTNTIQIAAPRGAPAAQIELVATMPGMAMVPTRVRLAQRGGVYRGAIALPMFGIYRADLTRTAGAVRSHGSARLIVPLILGN